MRLKMNKQSQEEILGFVLIILLVVVIAVVFLAINLRKPAEKLPSLELESFLQSSMRVSSDCYVSAERNYNLKDLIVSCSENNDKCLNGKTACESLNETSLKLLKNGWNPGEENPTKAYRFKVFGGNNDTMLSLKEGNCTGTRTFSYVFLYAYSGKVTTELEICS